MAYKVAVTSSEEYPVNVSIVRDVFASKGTVSEIDMPFRRLEADESQKYIALLRGYDAILVRSGIFGEDLLRGLDRLKIIAVHGAGYDQIDVKSAEAMGIQVVNAPGANSNAVVELAIVLMLASQRRLFESMYGLKKGRDWCGAKKTGAELYGKKLGLIGLGKIGQGVAVRAHAFGMHICAYDPYVASAASDISFVEVVDELETLLRDADVVSLHLPLTDATKHMINAKTIAMMKKSCVIINTSRGALIDEKDLYGALSTQQIAGAALDVFELEPTNEDNPLFDLDNVIVTPHIGGSTNEALDNVARMASLELLHFLETQEARYAVNAPLNLRGQCPVLAGNS